MSSFFPDEKHRQVLETSIDVPQEFPSFPLPLQHVGISHKTVWVCLDDNRGGYLPFTARILVNLPANRRGIHMSRIEQAIAALHDREFTSLPEYGLDLAVRVLEAQNGRNVSVELTGPIPLIRQAPVSKLNSIDAIDVRFTVILEKEESVSIRTIALGAGVHHLTACPCTLSYNKVLFDRSHDPWPLPTHSQRSKTELSVATLEFDQLPALPVLVNILENVLHVSQDLLKRPDEAELVFKAHKHPQFAEDIVREVARAAGEKFMQSLPPETRIQVHSSSLESIHIHDVECFVDTSLGEILETLQTTRQE